MSRKTACLIHIYNTGVNLAWAQVFTQNNYSPNDIREKLEAARAHAGAAKFFVNASANIDLALRQLQKYGNGPQTLDAIEAALFSAGGELRDYCCEVEC